MAGECVDSIGVAVVAPVKRGTCSAPAGLACDFDAECQRCYQDAANSFKCLHDPTVACTTEANCMKTAANVAITCNLAAGNVDKYFPDAFFCL